jgi:lysyl-tRNA synthetase class 1
VPEIIGRGTWYDKAAVELIQRERVLGRSLDLIRTESGLGASGFPHIGSLGDALRNYAVAMAVRVQGYESELVAFSDDKDGLRKVPAGMPNEMEKWLGYPVSSIPDIFGDCHESFGYHMSSLLLEAIDTSGAEYIPMSGTRVYEDGLLNDEILAIMENADRCGEIIKEELGQEKYTETLPYFTVCQSCGRIYTTNSYKYIPEEHKILYRCEGMEVKGTWLKGCGHEGEVDVLAGKGKLSWKVEFAARWRALDVRFEAYGKDIADSVRVNDRICREVLGYEPPMHVQYELFLDKGGARISKSAGNVFTPQVWYRYGSPQSLNLLLFKRFVGTKTGSIDSIPPHMDELDELEDVYFGKKKVKDEMERAKLTGLYEYCWMLKPPEEPSVHVPYNLMINLARVAPKGMEYGFIKDKLENYGYLDNRETGLKERVNYALNWVEDYGGAEVQRVEMTPEESKALRGLIKALRAAEDEDGYQGSVFEVARAEEMHPGALFRLLYRILIGQRQGPRFGPYVAVMGKRAVIEELERSLEQR